MPKPRQIERGEHCEPLAHVLPAGFVGEGLEKRQGACVPVRGPECAEGGRGERSVEQRVMARCAVVVEDGVEAFEGELEY